MFLLKPTFFLASGPPPLPIMVLIKSLSEPLSLSYLLNGQNNGQIIPPPPPPPPHTHTDWKNSVSKKHGRVAEPVLAHARYAGTTW